MNLVPSFLLFPYNWAQGAAVAVLGNAIVRSVIRRARADNERSGTRLKTRGERVEGANDAATHYARQAATRLRMAHEYLDEGHIHWAAQNLRQAIFYAAQILPAIEAGTSLSSEGHCYSWERLRTMVPPNHPIQHVIERLMKNPLCYRIGELGALFLPAVRSQVRSGIADGVLLTSELLKFANLEEGEVAQVG